MKEIIHIGIDVGSTTVKILVMNDIQHIKDIFQTQKIQFVNV